MKIGLIVLCRFNSSRLPGKILKDINGKPLLTYILERLQLTADQNSIIVATSDKKTDDPIEIYCLKNQIECYRGSLNDVAGRFLNCAEKYQLDYAVRINGDNIFTDHRIIDIMIDLVKSDDYNFVTNVKGRTFPIGMSIEIVNVQFYKKHYQHFKSNHYKEHVTLYFYENPSHLEKVFHYYNESVPEATGLKLAVDSEEDFNFAAKLISNMRLKHTDYGLKEITDLIKSLK